MKLDKILNLDWSCRSLRSVVLANDTKIDQEGKLIGDPTETAFIQYALDKGYDVKAFLEKYPRVAELPLIQIVSSCLLSIHCQMGNS